MNRKPVFIWMVSLLFLVLCIQTAHSDIYMKQKQHTDAMQIMGQSQPAEDIISETWMTANKMVVINPKQKIIIDMVKKTITMANHESKTYNTMPLDFSQAKTENNQDMAAMQQMMGQMKMKMTVTPTNERKKISQWNCRKYNQTLEMDMGAMKTATKAEIWASPDIKIDKNMYAKYTASTMAMMPGMSQNMEAMIKEAEKIDGVQVYSSQTVEMMGQTIKSNTELLEYKEGTAPANVFDIPKNYKKAEMFR
ncbi:MAG TPA: hypothetical protein PLP19_11305 [bacterium]|nr:hypothetical protein [bacterium]HPN44069.1 hypothetical protein [bacterium]